MPKRKGGGNFEILTLKAAFNKTACFGEFFIEFETQVFENYVIDQFESMGACSVSTLTFPKLDQDVSAVNALYRVHAMAEKSGISYEKGRLSDVLAGKLASKIAAEKQTELKFDDKTAAALKASVNDIDTKLGFHGQKLTDQGQMLLMQIQTLETTGMNVDEIKSIVSTIKHGMCNVISDHHGFNVNLEKELVDKTKEVDQIENTMGHQTKEINRLIAYENKLKEDYRDTYYGRITIKDAMRAANREHDRIAAENTRLIAHNERLVAEISLYDEIDTLDAVTKRAKN